MTLDVHTLDQVLLVGTGVLLLAILAVRLSVGFGLPTLLVYLLMGVAMGESGLGLAFDDAEVAHALGFAALMLILAEGGLTTPWPEIKPVMRLGVSLATIGVAVSVLVMAVFGHYVLGLSWELSVLLGAITSPTDAAAVFSVLRRVPLPHRLTGSLEAESGLNDAPTIVLVTLISTGGSHSVLGFAGVIACELSVGVAGGLPWGTAVPGCCGGRPCRAPACTRWRCCPSPCWRTPAAAAIHGSGFAAVYVAALILGQRRAAAPGGHAVVLRGGRLARPDRAVRDARPAELTEPDRPGHSGHRDRRGSRAHLRGRAPVSVAVSALVQPMAPRELAFISWAGLRGAVPIVLATIPLAEAIDGATELFDIVFVFVVIYTLLTGPTLPLVAKVLKVARRSEPRDLDVEAAPLERIAADLLQVTISPKSLMHGVEVGELRLPQGTSVALVVRDGKTMVPERRTVLRHGDDVLVVTPRKDREATEQRLRAVSVGGRLAQWLGKKAPS